MSVWKKFRCSFVGGKVCSLVPQKIINTFFHFPLALLAIVFYRYPARKLKVIGVTGTDGKTTVVSLIYHIFKKAGLKAGMISTVSAKIGGKEIETGLHVTAPNPWLLQKLLRKIITSGMEYVVLEATSHGLNQHRLLGCNFEVGVITNVTHEHLDYHGTWEKYLEAKAKLFSGVKVAVLNKDDRSYKKLKIKDEKLKIITYGIKNKADFTPKTFKFETPLPGEYNQYNCLAAIVAASALGIPDEKIRKSLSSFKGVKGRMEEINEGQDFKVIVDFAHTPNALEQVLKKLKQAKRSNKRSDQTSEAIKHLIVVFGCAGLRDRQKRPMMGKIAARYANFTILTAEDPRTEDVDAIIDQIAQGCLSTGAREFDHTKYKIQNTKYSRFTRVPDRQEAINFAIQKLAKKGDIVVICGKGHEKSMCFGRTEYPWSDHKAVRKALRSKSFSQTLRV